MIELNWNFRLGDKVTIPRNLNYQMPPDMPGEYVICEIGDPDDWFGLVSLRGKNGKKVLTDRCDVAYLTGKSVKNAELWRRIDPDVYQPEPDEFFKVDYYTEDDEPFDDWSIGWCGGHRSFSSSMVGSTWCYVDFPW